MTGDENAEELASLAPSGLGVGMVRNRLTLSWTAPAKDADSVTGYEILRGEVEAELTTLMADTASASTTYRDETATQAEVSYTYAVKALRGDDASTESNRASYTLPSGYTAASKELASKVYVHSQVVGETLEFAPQVVVSPDQEPPFTIWSGELLPGFNQFPITPTNLFTYNEVDYKINYISITEGDYKSGPDPPYNYYYVYADDLNVAITPPIGDDNIAAWKFVTPDGEFAFADAILTSYSDGDAQNFMWPDIEWGSRSRTSVSITGLPGLSGRSPKSIRHRASSSVGPPRGSRILGASVRSL